MSKNNKTAGISPPIDKQQQREIALAQAIANLNNRMTVVEISNAKANANIDILIGRIELLKGTIELLEKEIEFNEKNKK